MAIRILTLSTAGIVVQSQMLQGQSITELIVTVARFELTCPSFAR